MLWPSQKGVPSHHVHSSVDAAQAVGRASVHMDALSWHLSAHSQVIRCHLPLLFLQWMEILLFKSSPWNNAIYCLTNSSECDLTASLTGPKAGGHLRCCGLTRQLSPRPCPSRDHGCQAALILRTGNDPDSLPLPAPPSTQIGYLFHALPS